MQIPFVNYNFSLSYLNWKPASSSNRNLSFIEDYIEILYPSLEIYYLAYSDI
jgi:hypothetical protein